VLAQAGGEIVALDAATGDVERHVPAGRTPSAVAVAGRRLWAVDGDARTILRADPSSGTVDTLATGATPVDVVAGSGAVWVANGRRREATQALGPIPDEVVRFDPATSRPQASVSLPAGGTSAESGGTQQLAVSRGAVWAVAADQSVVRIDPTTADITARVRGIAAAGVASGGAGVWVLGARGTLTELDERTADIRRKVKLPTRGRASSRSATTPCGSRASSTGSCGGSAAAGTSSSARSTSKRAPPASQRRDAASGSPTPSPAM
jgi:hypothetical protein